MNASKTLLRQARSFSSTRSISRIRTQIPPTCPSCRRISQSIRRAKAEPADDPNFMSIVDNPPNLVRAGKRHGPGLIVLGTLSTLRACHGMADSKYSSNTYHRFRPWNLAGSTLRLEIQVNSQIRGSPGTRSPAFTSTYRSQCHTRLRLQKDIRHGSF
jgi:hypothetical protein